MPPEDPIESVLRGLAREKKVISMVHEMARRVSLPIYIAEKILSVERTQSILENRSVDLGNVARNIKAESERNPFDG